MGPVGPVGPGPMGPGSETTGRRRVSGKCRLESQVPKCSAFGHCSPDFRLFQTVQRVNTMNFSLLRSYRDLGLFQVQGSQRKVAWARLIRCVVCLCFAVCVRTCFSSFQGINSGLLKTSKTSTKCVRKGKT